jgi:hypothetical protein
VCSPSSGARRGRTFCSSSRCTGLSIVKCHKIRGSRACEFRDQGEPYSPSTLPSLAEVRPNRRGR